ncbi:dTMP kinase [Helicobacter mehlei]|uniref:Thymidylate kinase n=1 Tax=Helicobacter mehlei TaxID=2316080 RepID=A0A553V385_9HELI|nr:dTMP kinase [Helicobacter mehlei]TSA86916.1 dTMP kinase [Helicobacter mehlei]
MLIALEGVDASGKSTQIALLKQQFPSALFTKEPGGTPLGQALREMLLHQALPPQTQFLLFLADRALHVEQVLKPNAHQLIFSDRSLISGLAYAPYSLEHALELHRQHGLLEIVPDMVFFLRLDHATLEQRWQAKMQNMDTIEALGVEFLERTQDRLERACQILGLKTHVIDGAQSPQHISSQISKLTSRDMHIQRQTS